MTLMADYIRPARLPFVRARMPLFTVSLSQNSLTGKRE
jgi:hypothetical protein